MRLVTIRKSLVKPGALYVAVLIVVMPIFGQAQANWSGQVQCQLTDQDQTYSRQELQTWLITGAAPTMQGAISVYPATWSVTGQGALQRAQGTQITNIQWTANVPPMQASIAIFVRGSDNRLIIKPWHSQQRMDNALNGMRQIVANGVAQQPTNFSKSVWEWQFPRIEDSPTNTNVTGSTQSQAESGDAELLHHYGSMPPAATCRWQFTKSGMTPTNPNQMGMNGSPANQNPQGAMTGNTSSQNNDQNCESPAAVQQSFENMKSTLRAQYNQLIQGTSDPSQLAALQSQEQRMVANLNNQEQHDMNAAAQGCLQTNNQSTAGGTSYGSNQNGSDNQNTGNNPYSGGSQSFGGNQYPGNGQNGNSQYSGNGQSYGSNQYGNNSNQGNNPYSGNNSGNNQYSGNGQNSSNNQSGSNSSNNEMGSSNQKGSSVSSGQSPAPQLLSLNPSNVAQGSTVQINLVGQGTHWTSSTNVSFGPQVTLQSFSANPSGTSAVATINIAANAFLGSRPVMLMSGTETVGLPSGLMVTPAPSQQGSSSSRLPTSTGPGFAKPTYSGLMTGLLTGVSPATNNGQQSVIVTLTGTRTNFANGATTVKFVRASQSGSTNFQLQNAALAQMQSTSIPAPLQSGPVTVTSATTATVPLTINPSAGAGTYNVTVTTPTSSGAETVTLNNAFTVTTTMSLTGVAPITTVSKNIGPAAPTSANYLVTITGMICAAPTTGGGDAVYPAAYVRQYDRRSGQITMFTNVVTWVYGDVNGMQDQRKQAGSRTPTGGILAGDFIPPGFMPGIKNTLPAQANLFPLTVWQGTLTDGIDVLAVSPSIWESYGDNSLWLTWNNNQSSFNNSILLDSKVQNAINSLTFGTLFVGTSTNAPGNQVQAGLENFQNTASGADMALAMVFGGPLAMNNGLIISAIVGAVDHPSHDRPFGLSDSSNSVVLPNAVLVFTREMIEKRLGNNNWATLAVEFKDTARGLSGGERPGDYTMFIQIQRQ